MLGRTPKSFRISRMEKRRYATGLMFALPCIAILAVMMLSPLVRTFVYAFSKVEFPTLQTRFIGLRNFERVLARPEIPLVLKNTAVWIVCAVLLRFALGFVSAMALSGGNRRTKAIRVLVLLPWTIPSIVAANTWRFMMQPELGLLNNLLRTLGMGALTQNWLGSPATALSSVLLAYTWSGFPFVMMMLLAGIQAIPDELYESGRIDGANARQLFFHITVPSLKTVIVSVLLLEATSGLNSFDLLFTMTGGGPGGVTEILGLLIHRLGFTTFDFGGASALSVLVIGAAFLVFLIYGPTQRARARKGGA